MKESALFFLNSLKRSLRVNKTEIRPDFDEQGWNEVLELAEEQGVLPLVFNEICNDPAFVKYRNLKKEYQKRSLRIISNQIGKNNEFLSLLKNAYEENLIPIVLKGTICRNLYPIPFLRPSLDEDLLVEDERIDKYHLFFLKEGMYLYGKNVDHKSEPELSYLKEDSPLYIEVHKKMFDPDAEVFGSFNRFFPEISKHTISMQIEDVHILTLEPTYHFLFLILHAFKHFLHSGIGVRPICDIGLYADHYHEYIDWNYIKESLIDVDAYDFARALFCIVDNYLLEEPSYIKEIENWNIHSINELPLLEDALESGVHGASSLTRLHSSNITLSAVSNNGKKSSGILGSIFLPLRRMEGRYLYLKKAPFLLPVAWIQRILNYGAETIRNKHKNNNAAETIALGNNRVKMMKSYRIVKEEKSKDGIIKRLYRWSHTSFLAPFLSVFYSLISTVEFHALDLFWTLSGHKMPTKEERDLVSKNVTFIFKSFERQHLAKGLCRNISHFYPGASIIIADDSRNPLVITLPKVKVIQLPFNSGLSAGLKEALKEVKTPYVMRMDDDELLTVRSSIHTELRFLMDHSELDLIGFGYTTAIRMRSPATSFQEYYRHSMKDALRPLRIPHMTKIDDNHIVLGKVANIYLARTDKIREVGFDPNIRVTDHHEFFWRAAGVMTSAAALNTVVFHRHNPYEKNYRQYRSDYSADTEYISSKLAAMIREERAKRGQQSHKE